MCYNNGRWGRTAATAAMVAVLSLLILLAAGSTSLYTLAEAQPISPDLDGAASLFSPTTDNTRGVELPLLTDRAPAAPTDCGLAWRVVPSPNLGAPDDVNLLGGVEAISANDVWAMGGYGNMTTLALHWDG